MSVDRYLLVRAASVYVALIMTVMVWIWRRPSRPAINGAVLAFFWNVPAVLLLHLGAAHFGCGGTPVPFDPPRRLVTTGVYAYVRNPMQLSAVLLLFLLGIVVRNPWVSAAGVMAHIYSAGLAGWDEDEDLRRRFGNAWTLYRQKVRRWVPRWRPRYRFDELPSRLFVAERCEMCSEVGRWFGRRGARHLDTSPPRRILPGN
jgi:protein-S-isoprenylcysteine O-methyltransferase Ste14